MDLHHDAALRQDVTLLAGVHDVTLLQNFEGKRSVGFVLQLHLERLFVWVSGAQSGGRMSWGWSINSQAPLDWSPPFQECRLCWSRSATRWRRNRPPPAVCSQDLKRGGKKRAGTCSAWTKTCLCVFFFSTPPGNDRWAAFTSMSCISLLGVCAQTHASPDLGCHKGH